MRRGWEYEGATCRQPGAGGDCLLDVDEPENGANLALNDEVVGLFVCQKRHDDTRGLVHLADFFLDGHLPEELFSSAMGLVGGGGGGLPYKGGGKKEERAAGQDHFHRSITSQAVL